MKRFFPNWTTAILSMIILLLPWQTRWIYGEVLIVSAHTEFAVMSIFAVEIALVVGLCVSQILDRGLRQNSQRYRSHIFFGFLVLCTIGLSTLFVDRPFFSFAMMTHLVFALVIFVAVLSKHVSVKHVLGAFVASLFFPTMLGIIQVFGEASPASTFFGLAARNAAQLGDAVFTLNGERVLRAYGSFSHPNIFGGFLGVGIFAWWAFMAQVKTLPTFMGGVGGGLFRRKIFVITSLGTGAIFLSLILTGSRSAFLGVFLGVVLMFVARSIPSAARARFAVVAIGVVAILGSVFASFLLTDLAASIRGGGVNEERSLTERVALYKDFVPLMAAANPIIGYGIGSYVLSSAEFDPGKNVFAYQPIHNSLLLFLAETGILGFLLIFFWIARIVCVMFSRFPHRDSLYALGMGSVVITIACFDHYLWSSWSGLALMAFVFAMMIRLGEERIHT